MNCLSGIFQGSWQGLSILPSFFGFIPSSRAFWALWATGTDFDQPAGIGLLLLIGVVVNNGIVIMGGLVVSTFMTTLLLPTTAALSEDIFAAIGRALKRVWSFLRPWKTRASES